MMAYKEQNYTNMISLNFGSRRNVRLISRSVRFPLRGKKTGTLWLEVVRAPEPFWVFWGGEISFATLPLLTWKVLVMHVAMDWHINVNFSLQQVTKAHRQVEVKFYFFFNLGDVGGWYKRNSDNSTSRKQRNVTEATYNCEIIITNVCTTS
jgi:hypothetical protein